MAKLESQYVNSHCPVCGTTEGSRTNVLKRRVSADRPGNWKDPVRLGSTQCVYGEGEGMKTCSRAPCWHIVCQSGVSLVAFARAAKRQADVVWRECSEPLTPLSEAKDQQ